jgi:hypothetical protein
LPQSENIDRVTGSREPETHESFEDVIGLVLLRASVGDFRQLTHLEVEEELFVAAVTQQFRRVLSKPEKKREMF